MSWRNSAARNLAPFTALWVVHEGKTAKLRLAVQAAVIVLTIWLSDRVLAYFGGRPPHDLPYLLPGFIGGVVGLVVVGVSSRKMSKQ